MIKGVSTARLGFPLASRAVGQVSGTVLQGAPATATSRTSALGQDLASFATPRRSVVQTPVTARQAPARFSPFLARAARAGIPAVLPPSPASPELVEKLQGNIEALMAVEILQQKGILGRPDGVGTSVDQHLVDLLSRPDKEGFPTNGQLAAELVTGLAMPHGIGQGAKTFTCTAATVQSILAGTNPGEYLRVVKGLIFDGQVKTQGGDLLKANLSGLAADEGRNTVEDIFQESVMELGRSIVDNDGELLGRGVMRAVKRLGNDVAVGDDGLTPEQFSAITRSLTGKSVTALEPSEGFTDEKMTAVLGELLKAGKVPVGVQGIDEEGQATLHAVLIEKLDNTEVVFSDPGTGEKTSLGKEEFRTKLKMMFVPTDRYNELSNTGLKQEVQQAASSVQAEYLLARTGRTFARTGKGSVPVNTTRGRVMVSRGMPYTLAGAGGSFRISQMPTVAGSRGTETATASGPMNGPAAAVLARRPFAFRNL